MVDDDKHGLSFLRSGLNVAGYNVTTALSAAEARTLLENGGTGSFMALLTDHRMPGGTGLELIRWVRAQDETLAAVVITAEGEKELIKQSLESGATAFLEKPVTYEELTESIARAIQHTRDRRRFAASARQLAEAGRLDQSLNTQVSPAVAPHLSLFYQPLHEIGGDFLKVRCTGPGRFSLLVGDVSGHDATAGYIASYFQGLVRANLECGRPVEHSLRLFNRILCEEWGPAAAKRREMLTSLALSAMEIDLEAMEIITTVAGFPPPLLVDRHGFTRAAGACGFPLGWMTDTLAVPKRLRLAPGGAIVLFSDGLVDWSQELEVDPLSLAYTLLNAPGSLSESGSGPADDLILVRFQIDPEPLMKDQFQPIIRESYPGDEVEAIDELESIWRRSLEFSLEGQLGERLFDLIICIREAVLNALIHGCDRSPAKVCTLHVSYRPGDRRVRVRVDDPGQGHAFDLNGRLAELPGESGRQLGLGMVQHLSDAFSIENHGTSLIFDFITDGAPHGHA